MNTIRIDKQQARLIAHRGVSGLETENTNAAFVAAGNRSYFGIETDVHVTADGEFVVIHDDSTGRVANDDLSVEGSTLKTLQEVILKDKDGSTTRGDLRIPTLEEYIRICKAYGKTPVLELKNAFTEADIVRLCERMKALDYFEEVVFISFVYENLLTIKTLFPTHTVQFLTVQRADMDWLIGELAAHGMDIDVHWPVVTPAFMARCREVGVKVNCWTVDDPAVAEKLIELGVDFITSNILE